VSEREDRRAALVEIIAPVLRHLEPWYIDRDNDYWNVKAIRDDLPTAALWFGWDRGNCDKVHLSGGYPEDYQPYASDNPPSIGFSANKPPTTIARDIERRFLPEYLVLFQKTCGWKDRDIEALRRTNELLEYLCLLHPGARMKPAERTHGGQREGRLYTSYLTDGFDVWIFPSSGAQTCRFEMRSATPETVCAILQLLAQRRH